MLRKSRPRRVRRHHRNRRHETAVTGGAPATTNNRMELSAVIEALRAIRKAAANAGVPIEVRSDSTYVLHAFNKEWINKWRRDGFHTRTNGDLWEALDKLTVGQDITWTWVRGHSGDAMNERCDRLAVARAAAAPGHRTYWVDGQSGPTPQAPAPASEPVRAQTPPQEAYPAPDTGTPSATPWNRTPAQPPAPNSPSTAWRPATRRPPGPQCAPPWPSWPTSGQSSNSSCSTQATQSEKAGQKRP